MIVGIFVLFVCCYCCLLLLLLLLFILGSPISTRLQQLVDSVAVNQMSSQASQIKNSLHQPKTAKGGSAVQKIQPKVSSMTIPQNGIQKV